MMQRSLQALSNRLWGSAANGKTNAKVLKVLCSRHCEQLTIAPDLQFFGQTPASKLYFVHRALDDGDLYFISNWER